MKSRPGQPTTESRPGTENILIQCKLFRDPGCHAAFVEYLHRDGGGPIRLDRCGIDCRVLAVALEGNNRVTALRLAPDREAGDTKQVVTFRSMAVNKGLESICWACEPIPSTTNIMVVPMV
jgi:hypothetical protein